MLHVRPVFGDQDMTVIDVEALEQWLSGFQQPGAARKAWAVLRAVLRKAVRWGVLDVDVTRRDIMLPRMPGYEPKLLNVEETRRQLRGFYGHSLESWLLCASSCGLRTEEGYGLEWADLDLRSGTVRVRRGLQWVMGHEVVVDPKTELSRRTLPLPRFAVRRLREIRGKASGRLIGNLTAPQASRSYRSYCRRVGLPYCPPRNLRHSWATNALSAGVSLAVVSKFLGHSDIQTTARYYLKPDITALRDAQKLYERELME
jgi:integrase